MKHPKVKEVVLCEIDEVCLTLLPKPYHISYDVSSIRRSTCPTDVSYLIHVLVSQVVLTGFLLSYDDTIEQLVKMTPTSR